MSPSPVQDPMARLIWSPKKITVRAEGREIRRGIYRDIPTAQHG
jgi:hypothetical protein